MYEMEVFCVKNDYILLWLVYYKGLNNDLVLVKLFVMYDRNIF